MKFTYIVQVGFWDVKQEKERSETFHIKKANNKQTAESKAISQATTKFGNLVAGVDPFFAEKTLEVHNGKAIVFEYETTMDVSIPGHLNTKVLQAVNLHKLGRNLTMEDNLSTFGEQVWRDLQKTHHSLHATHMIPVLIKVTEDGQFLVSVREER